MISVCIPTYNGARYIRQQLQSILVQLGAEDEVIISDDSSTDNTVQIIREFGDPRIKLHTAQRFKSPIYNLEHALLQAKGDYIFLSDQDDVWKESKVSVMRDYLERYDVVVCDSIVVDDRLEPVHASYFELMGSGSGIVKNLLKNTYLGCCMALNRKILAKALPFPHDIPMHDIWLGFVGDVCGRTIFINEKLTLYRRHGNNASTTTSRSPYSIGQKIRFRWNLIKYLPRLLRRQG